jgi:hypothetical protein
MPSLPVSPANLMMTSVSRKTDGGGALGYSPTDCRNACFGVLEGKCVTGIGTYFPLKPWSAVTIATLG